MTDLQATLAAMRETLARADAVGHCRCYHESQERECHQHGDEHARLDGDMADALRKALNAVEAVRELCDSDGFEVLTREYGNVTVVNLDDLLALLDGEATS